MDEIIKGMLKRLNLSEDDYDISVDNKISGINDDYFTLEYRDGRVVIKGNCIISACNGLYYYLKKYQNVNLSWAGNRALITEKPTPFENAETVTIPEKYRVYLNYCTFSYSMCWWNWERWEKELDFMALNGINMPLAVVGNEAVWYETLQQFGYSKDEALRTISGLAFWPWQQMTNIIGYMPPKEEKYVYERLELGKKILDRMLEFGMMPIQQGFGGHMPANIKEKFPKTKISISNSWCRFPKCAIIDPTEKLFSEIGGAFYKNLERLMGAYHRYATDPFHENNPPKKSGFYLRKVGKKIEKIMTDFDKDAVWIMQAWSLRKQIVKGIHRERLLILDIDGTKHKQNKNFWGYDFIVGNLHNFGGRTALQGDISSFSHNLFGSLTNNGVSNCLGSGLFPEGIGQNPLVYDLFYDMITKKDDVNIKNWLENYSVRRTGSNDLKEAYVSLLKSCYGCPKNLITMSGAPGNTETQGSALASYPSFDPPYTGGWDRVSEFYNNNDLLESVRLFASQLDDYASLKDGYRYDVIIIFSQYLSNLFYYGQREFTECYKNDEIEKCEVLARKQLDLLDDIDMLLSQRTETNLNKWLYDSQTLATDENEKEYFFIMAKTLVTLWGDVDGDSFLYDYAWREWSGLIKEYYKLRWEKFYSYVISELKKGNKLKEDIKEFNPTRLDISYGKFGKEIVAFSKDWCKTIDYRNIPYDCFDVDMIKSLLTKYNIRGM